jgi:uncharacterized repeat protein (TIGR01451 family)
MVPDREHAVTGGGFGARRSVAIGVLLLAAAGSARIPLRAERPATDEPADAFGYTLLDDGDPRCAFEFVEIEGSGDAVWLEASGNAPAADEGGAVVMLVEPFELYGRVLDGLIVSSNGYLSAGSSLADEDGGDFSNDPRLPAVPDNPPAHPARLMVYHDDLTGHLTAGAIYTRHFASCPRPSASLGAEPCTVVQWTDWSDAAGREPFDAQAVLYHRSFSVVYQLRPGAEPLVGGTVGIQDARATSAVQYRPPDAAFSNGAICFFEPRFPPDGAAADLELTKTDKIGVVSRGEQVVYAVAVVNHGPSPVSEALVIDRLPETLTACLWSCEASEGSWCAADGAGDIEDAVRVAAGGWVDYRLSCETRPGLAPVANTASVSILDGTVDSTPQNDSATDVDRLVNLPPECSSATVVTGSSRSDDRRSLPFTVRGVRDPDGDPVSVSIEQVLYAGTTADGAARTAGAGCEPAPSARRRLSPTDGAGAGDRLYHIQFRAEDGRGGVCTAWLLVRSVSPRGSTSTRDGEVASYEACVVP